MKIYEVGGAVRDALLGEKVSERDWVVVGASAGELLALGYRQVGRDFPVFLHPDNGEEYALARTERKVSPGHTGFAVDANPATTLAEDLGRRDLTINAIARDCDGELIDPYHGKRDIEQRILRHVSDAFREDPLRVLRVARFAARFHHHGFTIAPETETLLWEMARAGELDSLSPDRVWAETAKALMSSRPSIYFNVLRRCGALSTIFPEVDALFGIPQPPQWHPEVDTGIHTMMALDQAARLSGSIAVRFAVLTHDLGKAMTPKELLPRHHRHETRSVKLLEEICQRLPVPRRLRRRAKCVARYHGDAHRAERLRPEALLKLITAIDGLRRPDEFEEFLLACEADARGRLGMENIPYRQADLLRAALSAAREVDSGAIARVSELDGPKLGEAIRRQRLAAIGRVVAAVGHAH